MAQNFGSKPKINCSMVIEAVITMYFLYFIKKSFMGCCFAELFFSKILKLFAVVRDCVKDYSRKPFCVIAKNLQRKTRRLKCRALSEAFGDTIKN